MKTREPDVLFDTLHKEAKEFSPTADRRKAAAMLGQLFKEQEDFLKDPFRFKSLLCPRRAGKSFSFGMYLITTCLKHPGAKCVFATLTQKTARGILWGLLKQLDKHWDLKCQFHNTNVTMTFPSGASIQLSGADSIAEIDKFRGQAFDLFCIDECKSFPPRVFRELIDEVVTPALADVKGTLCIGGTPGSALKGLFYDATRKDSAVAKPFGSKTFKGTKGWTFHSWDVQANVKMPHLWEEALNTKARNGWSNDNPIWRREYLGEWIADNTAFVYKYDPTANTWQPDPDSDNEWGLPSGHEWQFILGCDFGWEDPFALVVSAFSDTHPDMFQVFDFKERHMHVADIARKIEEVQEEFGEFSAMVGDSGGMGKMVIEELGSMYGIDMEAAEKTQKRDYIELVNSDLVEGRIKVKADSGISDEWTALLWKDGDKGERDKENKSCANHLADSFLYSWRYCYHHFFQDRVIQPEQGTPAYWEMISAQEIEKALARRRRERMDEGDYFGSVEKEFGDIDWVDEPSLDDDEEQLW